MLAVDPFVTQEQAANHGVELVSFDEVLRRADVVTVHVPLTRSTRGLIGRAAIAKMKPGSIVLNVARGGVVDEAAVAEALASGHLGGAGIDVFEHEPPTDSPLLEAPNTLLTPHLGASTAEAQILVAEEVAAQVLDVLEGRSARYAVNAPLLTPETARAIAPVPAPRGGPRPVLRPVLARWHAHPDARDRRRAVRARRNAPDRGGPPGPARDRDDRAGQPRQCGRPGEGARDHRRRAQDAGRRGVCRAAHPVR